jgi:hypothetical protein
MKLSFLTYLILPLMLVSCKPKPAELPKGSFGYDRQFILSHDPDALVLTTGDARILVSPKYQAKVFTSSAEGDEGRSFGWINYSAFTGEQNAHMNAYGGENRLWLGPEGGSFSLFFKKGDPQEFAHWKTPAAFDTESWTVKAQQPAFVSLSKTMQLTNYAGTPLSVRVNRNIALLDRKAAERLLRLEDDAAVHIVAYQTTNTLTNKGQTAWNEKTGAPCMWLLDMFPPSDQSIIVIPYLADAANTKPATTDYFGEIPADRIKFNDHTLFFKADGKSRGKLGIHPKRARGIAGSYDAKNGVLTLTLFNIQPEAPYLNQEWGTKKPPFSGDAVNAYNDGPLADGKQLGPFYELESVSPAAFLKPGESQVHHHSVLHFTGPEASLDKISQKTLGVTLEQIKKIF